MKPNWKKNLFRGLCLTSVAFVFQACYGTPQDFGYDLLLEGKVISKNTGLPIKGIKITIIDRPQYVYTDNDGNFGFYTELRESLQLSFEDVDGSENKSFVKKDTVLSLNNITNDRMTLNIAMEEKE